MANAGSSAFGRPLDGVRLLALEQMQALPFATQLMARLGADVVKIEPPGGESARSAQPATTDETGRSVGATYLRYNLGKRSVVIDIKLDRGRDLLLDLAAHFDVVCENLGPGRAERLGVGYEAVSARNSRVIYLSISGFGRGGQSPYSTWPAYAGVAEAMSGIYEWARRPHQPPVINPVGGLGDTGTGMFGVIGVLAALRHRDATGVGQLVDVAMLDSMLSICDISVNYWSMGMTREPDTELRRPYVLDGFRSRDGWFLVQISRDHQFERLARVLGHDEWLTDERFATRWGWYDHLEDTIRPAVESWASSKTKLEAAAALADVGVTAAPCNDAEDVVADPHVKLRNMLVEIPRTDGIDAPVLVAGNPVKLSHMAEGPEKRSPHVGEHTAEVLREVLGIDANAFATLTRAGVVGRG
jgi:crotonobetainyl-CoA:carnitine CoA-transferase CaiB-like acyl-CoA transferase